MADAQTPTLKAEAVAAKDASPNTRKSVSFTIEEKTVEIDLLDLQMWLNQLPNLRPGSGQKQSNEFPAFVASPTAA